MKSQWCKNLKKNTEKLDVKFDGGKIEKTKSGRHAGTWRKPKKKIVYHNNDKIILL